MKTPDRLLRLPAVIEMVGFRRDAIYTHMRQGKFPRQRKIGRSSAWLESEIIEWIRSRPLAQNAKTQDVATKVAETPVEPSRPAAQDEKVKIDEARAEIFRRRLHERRASR